MILYGASGHATVIASCLRANGVSVTAFFDDDVSKKVFLGISVVGSYDPTYSPTESLIIAVGNNSIRQEIAKRIVHPIGTVVHPSCLLDESATLGKGSVLLHGTIVQAGVQIGQHVIVNTGASVDHDCLIADFVHIAPGARLCGNVHIGEGTLVGAGSILTPNLRIGKGCTIAAGSVVTTHLPDGAVVRGNPARIIKKTII